MISQKDSNPYDQNTSQHDDKMTKVQMDDLYRQLRVLDPQVELKINDVVSPLFTEQDTFEALLNQRHDLIQPLSEMGVAKPKPIDIQLVHSLTQSADDVIVEIPPNNDSTVSILLSLMFNTNQNLKKTQTLVVPMAREQICNFSAKFDELNALSKITSTRAIGGMPETPVPDCQIVFGSPGAINNSNLDLSDVKTIVMELPEPVEPRLILRRSQKKSKGMVEYYPQESGLQPELVSLIQACPATRLVFYTYGSLNHGTLQQLKQETCRRAIQHVRFLPTNKGVEHYCVRCDEHDSDRRFLADLFSKSFPIQTLIHVSNDEAAISLCEFLKGINVNCEAICGGGCSITRFKTKQIQVLIASNPLDTLTESRQVDVVINYDGPPTVGKDTPDVTSYFKHTLRWKGWYHGGYITFVRNAKQMDILKSIVDQMNVDIKDLTQ